MRQYDDTATERLGQAARAAYCGQVVCLPQLKKWTCDACKASGLKVNTSTLKTFNTPQNTSGFSDEAQFWYVGKVEQPYDACLIAFRGSSNLNNWNADFDGTWMALEDPGPEEEDVMVHRGFYLTYLNLESKLINYLQQNSCSDILITGHSLGAAQSTLASYFLTNGPYLKKKYDVVPFNIVYSYQFESPRVGNTRFAELYTLQVANEFKAFRVTYGKDMVIFLPTPNWNNDGMKYTHVNYEVYYPSLSATPKKCLLTEDPSCSFQFQKLPFLWNMADHCAVSWLSTRNVCQCNTCGPAER